ncbi:GerAB/ArcD/ProY family transporter [Cytobacillus oceanisediminis]|uniref:GerAB/ArcD/ProY family transporter n=1 Tax=Cytobacillus oceanisediminis TaxID=665099 RepID=UPI001D14AFA1|nr:GerAB/ArcD/ProY family transporter [Cytobacillus oceanisediminis]MCC3646910.1 GerAB/ArcD/ProY family transporter [Cytobacillus oceanisediminis]
MNVKVEKQFQVSAFFTFFLIHSSQTGVGILNFQSQVIKHAEQDAWISLIITWAATHIILYIIFKLLGGGTNDLVAVHQYCFGKAIGSIMSVMALVYFWLASLTVLRAYIEVIQIWVYPSIKTWQLCFVFGLTFYYIISSGFRSLTGFSFWGVILPAFLFFLIYFPLMHANYIYLLPAFSHSLSELFLSSKGYALLFLGFEWILMYYPFLRSSNNRDISKWAYLGNIYTLIVYLIITLISFLYFNQEVLQHLPWPTLMMVKIVKFSFLERFEYVFIFIWLLVIISPICISLWACTRIVKRTFSIPPKVTLLFLLIAEMIASVYLQEFKSIDYLVQFTSNAGVGFVYVYLPLLLIIKWIKSHFMKNRLNKI